MSEPGLSIHSSNRLDILVEHLAATFGAAPSPALEREVIIVRSRGMARWLTLQLADRSGLAASLDMPFPGTFCRQLAERLLDGGLDGREASPGESSLFDRELLTWRIFDRMRAYAATNDAAANDSRPDDSRPDDSRPDDSDDASPATYLEHDPDQIKRYQLSVRLAGLLEGYQLFRPRMLLDWEASAAPTAGESTGESTAGTARHAGWQARLWRSLVAGVAEDGGIRRAGGAQTQRRAGGEEAQRRAGGEEAQRRAEGAPAQHLARRCIQLLELLHRSPRPPSGLPRRLSVFGISTLPPIFLQVAVALARFIPVRIYFLSPTYHYWGELRSEREAARIRRRLKMAPRAGGDNDRADLHPADDHLEEGHPLLAALGRQGRDFFNLLQEADAEGAAWHELDLVDLGDDSLLHGLQSDVLHLVDRGGPGADPRRLDASDESLRVHACHSPMREMEVLRDQLLAAFEADPTLEPSDVLVMVPRIGDYSPYIEAAFGVTWEGTPPLPFAIADRAAGREQPAAETLLRLLDLVGSRLTPRAVLDLFDTPAVGRVFGIAATDVPELRRRIQDSRIRWGMDGAQRAADFALPPPGRDEAEVGANTWRAGLDRLLMGYAAGAAGELVAGVAPHAGSTTADAELLGRLAAFTRTLFRHLRRLRDPRPAGAWANDLGAALEDLYRAENEDEESALDLVLDTLEELHLAGGSAAVAEPLSRQVVRAHLGRRLAAEGSGSGFLDGRITFCALKPMRAVPFKVICVAGLAEGAFPRRDAHHSFDLMAAAPRPGDRSLAEDDRYLFLETLLAAGDRLILTYQGRSEKDGRRRAPASVLSELLDYLDRALITGDGRPARELVVVEHRLHAFSPEYYRYPGRTCDPPGRPDPDRRLFSYSRENFLLGGRAERPAATPFVAGERPGQAGAGDAQADEELEVELPELVELWVNPARHYCRKVLRLMLPEHRQSDDAEPFDVDFLDRYRISQWLLARRLKGLSTGGDELDLLRRQGELPLAGLGAAHYSRLARRVDDFVATLPRHAPREAITIEIVGDGFRLHGRLEELTDGGALRYRCTNLKPKDLVRAWVTHVACAAWQADHNSDLPLLTHLAGIDRALRFGAVDDAPGILSALVAGYRAGLRRPLPLFERASHAYVEARRKQRSSGRSATAPLDAARHTFDGGRFSGDADDPYVALCFRDRDALAEDGFTRWAETLWVPLFEHAEVVDS